MSYNKTYKYRIYPTNEQQELIDKTFGCCRFVFNFALAKHKEKEAVWSLVNQMIQEGYFSENKYKVNYFNTHHYEGFLPELKKQFNFLKEVDSIALQNSIQRLGYAYKRFYSKQGKNPKFKSKRNRIQSYTTKSTKNNIQLISIPNSKGTKIKLPKLGFIKCKVSRTLEGEIKTATIQKSSSGKYFVSLCCKVKSAPLPQSSQIIGIDVGIKSFATMSNGEVVSNPNFSRLYKRRINLLQKKLSRQTYRSNNYFKTQNKLAKIYEKINNQRHDFLHKLSTKLIRENQAIAIESLKIKDMLKNHNLASSIIDVAWGKFRQLLEYKASWYDRKIVVADAHYPSSQLCSSCGFKNKDVKKLNLRQWVCPNCKISHDRDVNAAINLQRLIST